MLVEPRQIVQHISRDQRFPVSVTYGEHQPTDARQPVLDSFRETALCGESERNGTHLVLPVQNTVADAGLVRFEDLAPRPHQHELTRSRRRQDPQIVREPRSGGV